MRRTQLLPLTLLLACLPEEEPVAPPPPPPPEPVLVTTAGHVDAPPEQERDPAAARARLDALRANIPEQTPAAFLESAESAAGQQHHKEARDAFRGLFLHHPHHESAPSALERATRASFQLGEHEDGLTFYEDGLELVRGTLAEARLLRVLGALYLEVPHWGTEKAGEFHRGRYEQGTYRYTYRRDRRTAVRRLEAARAVFAKLGATTERYDTQLDLIRALGRFTPYDSGWGYWYDAWDDGVDDDRVDEHGADERAGHYGRSILYRSEPRGVPVDAHGRVVFTERPEVYAPELDTTAKIKFLAHELSTIEGAEAHAAAALYQQALMFESRHGANRLLRLSGWWWNGSAPYKATIDETPLYELDDDQVLGLIATHIGRYRVPDDESTLALLDRVLAEYGDEDVVHDALIARATFFQSRQQYDRAADAYDDYLERFPKGRLADRARSGRGLLARTEAVVVGTSVQPAGSAANVEVSHRNVTTLYGRAELYDPRALLEAFESAWRDDSEPGFYPSNLAYYLYANQGRVERARRGEPEDFVATVKDDGTRRFAKSSVDVPIEDAGFWVVRFFADEARTQQLGRGVVMLTDTAIVEKGTPKGPIAWVVDARTGQPIEGAKVRVFDFWRDYEKGKSYRRYVESSATTNADGIARVKRRNYQRVLSVQHGDRFAFTGDGFYYSYAPSSFGSANVGLVYTDRPVYRPANEVHLMAWARHRRSGEFLPAKDVRSIQINVYDPKGAQVFSAKENADGGGAEFLYPIPADAPLGLYRVNVYADGAWVQGQGQFRVEEYKAPEIEVSVSVGEGPARLGTKIPVRIEASYLFGGPAAGAKVHYKIHRADHDHRYVAPGPWDWLYGPGYGRCYYAYRWFDWWGAWGPRPWVWYPWWGPAPEPKKELVLEGRGTLGPDGTISVSIDTTRAKALYGEKDQRFTVEAEVTDSTRRTIVGAGAIVATRHAFFVSMATDRGYYRPGETMTLEASALRFDDSPIVDRAGRFSIHRVRFTGSNGDSVVEKPVFSSRATTDERGMARVKWDVAEPGQYRLTFTAEDEDGEEVLGSAVVWVYGARLDASEARFNHLEIITDKRTYAVGETARLLIASNVEGAKILFSDFVDGGALERPRVLALKGKTMVVEVPITERHVPNFFVEALVVGEGRFSEEVREIIVPPPAATLDIELKPAVSEARAGAPSSLEIVTRGADGAPVSALVAVSVFDRSVLYIQPELTPDPRVVFWGQKRHHRASSANSLAVRLGPFEAPSSPAQQATWALNAAQRSADRLGAKAATAKLDVADDEAEEERPQAESSFADKDANKEPGRRDEKKRQLAANEDTPSDDEVGAEGADGTTAEPRVRKNFADTAAWRVVKTGADGRARIDWTFPDNLTTWRVKAIGATDSTRVGQAATSIVTTKKLLVQLQAPRFFRERDEVLITGVVHNRLPEAHDVNVKLDVTEQYLLLQGPAETVVEVPAGEHRRVGFRVKVQGEGRARVRVSALTGVESDAKELEFPVLVHGFEKTDAAVGSIPFGTGTAERSVVVRVPEDRRPEQTELVIRAAPSLATAMIDALPFLLDYPYGCTEQTMSRFVPAVVTKKTLQQAGGVALKELAKIRASLDPQKLDPDGEGYDARRANEYAHLLANPVYSDAKMNDIIRAGLARIAKLQRPDGGWGWWGGDHSSVYTTAYVLWGLAEAHDADTAIDASMLSRGVAALVRLTPEHVRRYETKGWVSDTDAFLAYVLARHGRPNRTLTGLLYERRGQLSVYGKSLLALALWRADDKDDARVVLRNAAQFMKEDPENQTAWLDTPRGGWWYWWNNDIESNATYLRALVTIRPDDPSAPKIVKWLLANRQNGYYWRSTRDTAITISSFGHYLRARRVSDTDYDLEILVDGELAKTVHIDHTNLLTFDGEVRLRGDELSAGEHTITFRRKGKGAVYFNTYLTYFTMEEDAPPSGLEIRVARRYFLLERDDREHTVHDDQGGKQAMREVAYRKVPLDTGARVDSGDLILVELELESKNDYTFLAFEDPKPAGMEPVALRSGTVYGEAVTNMELRDDRVVFFLRHLQQGKLRIDYRLRAEIPGEFHAMPTRGFAMYAPELRATSSEMRIAVDGSK